MDAPRHVSFHLRCESLSSDPLLFFNRRICSSFINAPCTAWIYDRPAQSYLLLFQLLCVIDCRWGLPSLDGLCWWTPILLSFDSDHLDALYPCLLTALPIIYSHLLDWKLSFYDFHKGLQMFWVYCFASFRFIFSPFSGRSLAVRTRGSAPADVAR